MDIACSDALSFVMQSTALLLVRDYLWYGIRMRVISIAGVGGASGSGELSSLARLVYSFAMPEIPKTPSFTVPNATIAVGPPSTPKYLTVWRFVRDNLGAFAGGLALLTSIIGVSVALDRASNAEGRVMYAIDAGFSATEIRAADRQALTRQQFDQQSAQIGHINERLLDLERNIARVDGRLASVEDRSGIAPDAGARLSIDENPIVEATAARIRTMRGWAVTRTFQGGRWGLWADSPRGVSFRALLNPNGTWAWLDTTGHPTTDPTAPQ